jgi:putative transposase
MTDKWLTAKEIAYLLIKKPNSINVRAKREGWPYRSYATRGGQERRYNLARLPEDVQAAYAASIGSTLAELTSQLYPVSEPGGLPGLAVKPWKEIAAADRHTAQLREKLILSWIDSGRTQLEFCAAYTSGAVDLPEIRSRLGDTLTDSTLSRWFRRYKQAGVAALAPCYEHRRGGNGAALDEHTRWLIYYYYLNKNKISLRSIQRTLEEKEQASVGYAMLCRFVRSEIDAGTKDFFRRGEKYFHDHYESYIERDYTRYQSMQVAVADHKTFDFVSRVKRADGWHIVRLSLTCITDMRSRKILGWCVDEVPSTLTIIRAVKMMVEHYGCPQAFLVDNGKDFSSYWFAGNAWNEQHRRFGKKDQREISSITGDLGSVVQFCTPYRGQSKPIERFFGFVSAEHDKSFKSYVGSNTSDRIDETKLYWGNFNGGEKIPIEELPTVEEVRAVFARFAEWFNTKWHHSGQGMDHKTPGEVFEENRGADRAIPEEYQKYIWTRRKVLRVQRNGVRVDGQWYINPEMQLLDGQDVEIRLSIDDIGAGYIFDLKTGAYLYDADCSALKDSGIKEENVRRVNLMRKAAKGHIKKYQAAINEIAKDRKTQLEELREEESRQVALKVVGGEDLEVPASPGLALVKGGPKGGRKLKGLFGEVITVR